MATPNVVVQLNLNNVGEVRFRILSQKEDRLKPRSENNLVFSHKKHSIRIEYSPVLRTRDQDTLVFYLQGRDDIKLQTLWWYASTYAYHQPFNGKDIKEFMHLINLYNQLPAETAWNRIETTTEGCVWESPTEPL